MKTDFTFSCYGDGTMARLTERFCFTQVSTVCITIVGP